MRPFVLPKLTFSLCTISCFVIKGFLPHSLYYQGILLLPYLQDIFNSRKGVGGEGWGNIDTCARFYLYHNEIIGHTVLHFFIFVKIYCRHLPIRIDMSLPQLFKWKDKILFCGWLKDKKTTKLYWRTQSNIYLVCKIEYIWICYTYYLKWEDNSVNILICKK